MTIFTKGFSAGIDNVQDRFFNATALGNATAVTSVYKEFARVGGKIELVVEASGDYTPTADITFETLASDSTDTGYAVVDTKTFTAGAVVDGDVLYRYAPDSSVALYCKVRVTTTTDESANAITGKILERRGA